MQSDTLPSLADVVAVVEQINSGSVAKPKSNMPTTTSPFDFAPEPEKIVSKRRKSARSNQLNNTKVIASKREDLTLELQRNFVKENKRRPSLSRLMQMLAQEAESDALEVVKASRTTFKK
jgi:hypothetical protein